MIEKKIDELIAALDRNTASRSQGETTVIPGKSASPKVTRRTPTKTEEELVADIAADAAAKEVDEDAPTLEQVKGAVDKMLKANKRDGAIKLLASFGGAKSATGIVEQGAKVMAQFIAEAEDILLNA